jgi:hypothetical protein
MYAGNAVGVLRSPRSSSETTVGALVGMLFVAVVVDCATAGQAFPWPVPRDFWRVCSLLVVSCAAGVLPGFSRGGYIQPLDGRITLAVACGFLLRGAIHLLLCLCYASPAEMA